MDPNSDINIEIDHKPKDLPPCKVYLHKKDLDSTPVEEILSLLHVSNSHAEKWAEVAFAYLNMHKDNEFQKVLSACIEVHSRKGNEGRNAIIYLHNILAAYYIGGYMAERDLSKKEELRTKVFSEVNLTEEYSHDHSTMVKKGIVNLIEENLKQAKESFDVAFEMNSQNLLAHFGKACVAYNAGNYSEALKIFQTIFKQDPNTALNVRQCIGLCFYKLNDLKKAKQAFLRCLQLDSQNDYCLTYLGIISLRESQENISQSLDYFTRAFKINPNNPLCILQLANHYFVSGDLTKSEILAKKGLSILESYKIIKSLQKSLDEKKDVKNISGNDIHIMRSELLFLLGKIGHAKETYGLAMKFYKDSLEENANNHAAEYCLAQVLIQMKQFTEAESRLRKLREMNDFKIDPELGKLLAFCQVKLSKRKEAIEKYEEVVNILNNDIETLIELAQLLETENPTKALIYYKRAHSLLQNPENSENFKELSNANVEILNNIGVANSMTGKYQDSKEVLKNAIKSISDEHKKSPTIRTNALKITLRFNLAYVYEMQGQFAEATGLYKQIIAENPQHSDSHMRLSIMAFKRGNYVRAIEYAENAKKNHPDKKSNTCTCFIGYLYTTLKENHKALEIFNSISASTGKHDTYALIGGAAMLLINAQSNNPPNETFVKNALQDFVLALEHDERNAYAAIGVANCLALLGKTSDAIQILKALKETTIEIPAALVNLARVYMLENRRIDAIPVYKKYIEKYAKKEEFVELELSYAYFQEQMYDEAMIVLKKLEMRNPSNPIIKYNTAVCLHQHVKQILSKKIRKATETQDAIRKIEIALSLIDDVKKTETVTSWILLPNKEQNEAREEILRNVREITKKAEEQSFYYENVRETAKAYLKHDQDMEKELMRQKAEREALEKEREMKEKESQSTRQMTEEEKKEIERRIEELNEGLRAEREQKSEKKKRGKSKPKKEEEFPVEEEPLENQDEVDKEIHEELDKDESDFENDVSEDEAKPAPAEESKKQEYDPMQVGFAGQNEQPAPPPIEANPIPEGENEQKQPQIKKRRLKKVQDEDEPNVENKEEMPKIEEKKQE